jgi:hypothetical protein
VCSEKVWKKPQVFANLRKKRVNIEDKEKRGPALSLHTLMQIYCVQKYNHEQTLRTGEPSYLTLNDFQHTPDLVKFLRSNVETLKEMLDLAGIYYGKAFIPSITGLDLKDPSVLRRLLLNGSLGGLPFDVNKARKSGKIMEFRKAEFTDPKTGLEVRGHGLMLYFSVQDYLSKHPGVIPSTAVFELKLGRSSLKVMREILQLAGIGKDK